MKVLRPISSIVFCVLVIISSSYFIIGVHLCGGDVQNTAFLNKANGCSTENELPPCLKHEIKSKSCCEDQTIVHEAQGFKASVEQIHIGLVSVLDIEQTAVLIAEVIPSTVVSRIKYYQYDPPLRSCDLTVAFQVFLI